MKRLLAFTLLGVGMTACAQNAQLDGTPDCSAERERFPAAGLPPDSIVGVFADDYAWSRHGSSHTLTLRADGSATEERIDCYHFGCPDTSLVHNRWEVVGSSVFMWNPDVAGATRQEYIVGAHEGGLSIRSVIVVHRCERVGFPLWRARR